MTTVVIDDEPRCTIDPERPCRSCLADGPWACPYPYLLATDRYGEGGAEETPADERTSPAVS